jgi:hypothetical protein
MAICEECGQVRTRGRCSCKGVIVPANAIHQQIVLQQSQESSNAINQAQMKAKYYADIIWTFVFELFRMTILLKFIYQFWLKMKFILYYSFIIWVALSASFFVHS